MKTLSILAAVATIAAVSPALAQEQLPAAYLVHKLSADGLELRSIEAGRGSYEARVVATDGSIVKVGVDGRTADLTDAYSHAKPHRAETDSPRIGAVEAMVTAAGAGYWDLRELEYKRGHWLVEAADDQGRVRKVAVDGTTGMIE
jgi:hypothetical protein